MKTKAAPKLLLFAVASILGAACSAGSVTRNPVLDTSQYQYTAPPPSTPTPVASPTPSNNTETSGAGGTGLPPIQMRVGTIGYNAVMLTIDVRAVLKVRFEPGVQDEVVQGTGFSPNYSRLGVYINVGTKTQATEMLSNGLLDGKPQKSSVIDFSNSFTKTCDSADTTCHQPVTIKVFKPNNDYFCMNFGTYCNWAQMYETHPWHGTLYIQTDDTDPL